MDALSLLHSRNSAPRLVEPAPQGHQLENLFQAAFRAPDHARLRPWRFLTIEGNGRDALGQLFVEATNKRASLNQQAALTVDQADKLASKPLRAPLIIVVIASPVDHVKVPLSEQLLSAGCAAHGILLAAHAQGFAGVWRTGANAFDKTVNEGLGLDDSESIIGFIYLGTVEGDYKSLTEVLSEHFCKVWPAS